MEAPSHDSPEGPPGNEDRSDSRIVRFGVALLAAYLCLPSQFVIGIGILLTGMAFLATALEPLRRDRFARVLIGVMLGVLGSGWILFLLSQAFGL